MAHIATPKFLSGLKRLYPSQSSYVNSLWYAVAAIMFSASNVPEAVPLVLKYVLNDLKAIGAPHSDRLAAARKIRDAVFKSGMICGFPKVINALILLHEATPQALHDKETRCVPVFIVCSIHRDFRNPERSAEELAQVGKAYFDQTYGETARSTQALLRAIYPDLVETSFAMISALIAIDAPRQIGWHLEGALRNCATREEVRGVQMIAIQIAQAAGVVWKGDIPDLD